MKNFYHRVTEITEKLLRVMRENRINRKLAEFLLKTLLTALTPALSDLTDSVVKLCVEFKKKPEMAQSTGYILKAATFLS